MKISYRLLDGFSVGWLAIGIVVFLLGWCVWWCSMPLTIAIVGVMWLLWRRSGDGVVEISHGKFWLALLIGVLMMAWCGVGGYVVQPNDHFGRNAIFTDTFRYAWPVFDEMEGHYQCYYLAFWMVPALVGKLFHSLDVGFFAQLVWMCVGFHLLFLQICRFMGKARVSYLFFLYLFSGIKLIGCLLYFPLFGEGSVVADTVNIIATGGSAGVFHAGSVVQLLHDPFNQTVPLFLAMIFMLNNRHSSFIPFVYALLLLYAPFPFAGLAPIVFYLFIRSIAEQSSQRRMRFTFSFENFVALFIIIVVALYLTSNINGSHRGLRPTDNLLADVYDFVLYMAFDLGIYLWLGYKACTDKRLLWIAVTTVAIFGWFQIGLHNDFCFRTNMPLIFLLVLLVTKRYYMQGVPSWIKRAIIVCYIVGGLPAQTHPCLRLLSSYFVATGQKQEKLNQYQHFKDVRTMYIMQQTKMRNDDLKSTFNSGEWEWMTRSFKGRADSFFFTYLVRK